MKFCLRTNSNKSKQVEGRRRGKQPKLKSEINIQKLNTKGEWAEGGDLHFFFLGALKHQIKTKSEIEKSTKSKNGGSWGGYFKECYIGASCGFVLLEAC